MNNSNFQRVQEQDLVALRDIVGADYVFTSAEDVACYASDETENFHFPPEVVVRPETAEEISAVMTLANARRIPVTPRGAGTGLSGGALAVHAGIVLSLERMNRILEIDERNLFVVTQPGVTTQLLQEAVAAKGLFYPPDPASRGSCFIGGNVAENSGGPRAVKYGVTKDYVYGMQAVLPTGKLIRSGGKLIKNVSGYNLSQLITGSEGTLAIVTEVTLRLLPEPKYRRTMLVAFDREQDAAVAVTAILKRKVQASALEFMEGAAIELVADFLGQDIPNRDAAAQLLIEVDGNEEDQLEKDIAAICEVCVDLAARDVVIAQSQAQQESLWNVRRKIGEAVKAKSAYKEEDTVVPPAELPRLVAGVRDIAERYALQTISYGHAGDGNVHVNILRGDRDDVFWQRELPKAIHEIFKFTVSLGGSISGEHGIGWVQRAYLPIACGPNELEAMQQIKLAWDPNGILNPGKIFL